ncbi:arylesterase [uncultured Paraglaciecola sp.]|uniref:arylesterase n=1 Tax=uncultured Paraglaciecola sp. TaxID=1765024 RepID=UPI0025D67890|nr:arylesterase [uncultured Paraglaciecola sp.]
MLFLNINSFRNKIYLILILIPLLLISDQLQAKETKLLILGDSLSAAYGLKQEQGWVSLLQDAWQSKDVNVVNAAISGETTDGALARLPRLLKQHEPTHIFVELGGNDGLQGHPVSKMRNNLEKIIQLSQSNEVTVILQQMQIPTNYGKRYTQMFTSSYAKLSEKYAVIMLPFFLENIALDKNLMQRDGIHPNAEAQIIIAKDMQKILGDIIFPSQNKNN